MNACLACLLAKIYLLVIIITFIDHCTHFAIAGLLCNFTFVGVMRPVRDRPITELSLVVIKMMETEMAMNMIKMVMVDIYDGNGFETTKSSCFNRCQLAFGTKVFNRLPSGSLLSDSFWNALKYDGNDNETMTIAMTFHR